MRFIPIVVLVCLICSAYGQEQPGEPVVVTTTEPGAISRIFFWLKKPEKQVTGTIAASPSPTDQKDSSSEALPKESTDRMINDAITEGLLEESREKQSIVGSPFIAEKEEDRQVSASETKIQQASPNREAHGKSMDDKPNDVIPLTEAFRIVSSSNLTHCVARVVCELSCNANAYGNPGRIVFRNMIKIQFDQSIKGPEATFFRKSAAKGRQIVQAKQDCKECFTVYPSCNSSSKDLIAVSSMFKL